MKNHLALSVLGIATTDVFEQLCGMIGKCECNIETSHVSVTGDVLSAVMLLSGSWVSIARVEDRLQRLKEEHQLQIALRRTGERALEGELMPYAIDLVAKDQVGILHSVVQFIQQNDIHIQDLHTHCYESAHTKTGMFSLHLVVHVPAELSIATLRADFMDFCDQMNLDAVIEPIKSS